MLPQCDLSIMLRLRLLFLVNAVFCTTEWFGDLRAHLNPPQSPPFYDIVYDDGECPFGMESIAIPEFVYFGEMVATKSVRDHSACLQFCLETTKCKAVNYFESLGKREPRSGFCELLIESQYDNPRLMRPFKKATYYEKIRCRTSGEDDEQPFIFNKKDGEELLVGDNGGVAHGGKAQPQQQRPDEMRHTAKPHLGISNNKGQQSGSAGTKEPLPTTSQSTGIPILAQKKTTTSDWTLKKTSGKSARIQQPLQKLNEDK